MKTKWIQSILLLFGLVSSNAFAALKLMQKVIVAVAASLLLCGTLRAAPINLPPVLGIAQSNGQVTVSWSGSDQWLQFSESLDSNSWANMPFVSTVNNGLDSFTFPALAPSQFYRLVDSPFLPPPTRLTLEAEEDGAGNAWFSLWWDTVPAATSYNLYYAADPSVSKNNYLALAESARVTGITNPYMAVSNLIVGHQYYFVVTAVSSAGESVDSGRVTGIFSQTGSVAGTVSALLPDGTNFALATIPGVIITLNNLSQPQFNAQTASDVDGEYAFANQIAGTYQLCWSAPGFADACLPQLITISNASLHIDLTLTNDGSAMIYGHVSLSDGSAAGETDPFYGIRDYVDVILDNGGSNYLRQMPVNSTGDYLMANLAPQGGLVLTATNGLVGVSSNINASGAQRIDLQLPEVPPQIISLTAMSNGVPVIHAAPGTPLQVTVVATNFGPGPLQYSWVPGGDTTNFSGANAPTVSWTLPSTAGSQTLYVVVSDNGGGHATARVDVSTDAGALFAGTVIDTNNAPVAGANVNINGQATVSDSGGYFSLVITNDAVSYTVISTLAGYIPFTGEIDSESQNIICVMVPEGPCTTELSTQDIELEDLDASEVIILSNSLVTATGALPQNPICVMLDTLDPCDPTKELGLTTVGVQNGTNVDLEFLAIGVVRARDASGATLGLTNQTMDLNIAADTNCLADASMPVPFSPQLWLFDEQAAVWRPIGTATSSGTSRGSPSFAAQVGQLGVVAVAQPKPDPKIFISLELDDTLSVPAVIRIESAATGKIVRLPDTVGEAPLFRRSISILVPKEALTVEVLSQKEAPEVYPPIAADVLKTAIVQISIPATVTNTQKFTLGLSNQIPNLPAARVKDPNEFLTFKYGAGSKASAESYYDMVDPPQPTVLANGLVVQKGRKTTLKEWQELNGFTVNGVAQADDAAAIFFNACDLGFGRSMHFKRRRGADGNDDLAFYVANHPSASDAVIKFGLIATVAMDYVFNPQTKKRITAFYVYNKAGAQLLSADLDGRGEKFAPNLCLICHGADPAKFKALGNGADKSGDLGARFIPFDPDSYTYSILRNRGQANQLASFLALNKAVMATGPTTASSNLVVGWYGGTNFPKGFDGTFVPSTWQNTGANANIKPAYSGAFAISCRSCHVVRADDTAFASFTELEDNSKVNNFVYKIPGKPMPNALRTFSIFWGSQSANIIKAAGAPPDQTLLLQKALGLTGARPTKFP